jgi:hypothetical protein
MGLSNELEFMDCGRGYFMVKLMLILMLLGGILIYLLFLGGLLFIIAVIKNIY